MAHHRPASASDLDWVRRAPEMPEYRLSMADAFGRFMPEVTNIADRAMTL
jgi:hypothetical protein